MDIPREDVLLIVLVAAAVIPIGYMIVQSGSSGFTPDTPAERYCVDLAASIEANVTFANRIKSCRCVPPSQVNASQFPAPPEVENATRLVVVSCTMDSGRTQLFPVRRIRANYTGNYTKANATPLRGSP